MPAAGYVMVVAVVLIVLALVYYLVSTIVALRQITFGLDDVIESVGEIYTKGTLTLARLGREAPIAAASPSGPAVRDAAAASSSARKLYPDGREYGAEALPRSPVIGTDAPVQYEQRDDIGRPRKRRPTRA